MYCNVSAIQKSQAKVPWWTKVEHKMEIYVGIYSFIN